MANSNKDKRKSRDVALDKFDFDVENAPKPRKNNKIKGRPKNPFVRFAIAAFPQAADTTGEKVRKAMLLMAVAILIGTVVFLGWQIMGINKGGDVNNSLASLAGSPNSSTSSVYKPPEHIANPEISLPMTAPAVDPDASAPEEIDLTPVVNTPLNIDFNKLKAINPDTRAWIKITGTQINNVVVQAKDNSYYLTHDFYGKESVSGTIFSSYRNTWDESDDNKILFGHNMGSGDFFAYVMHYVPDNSAEPLAFYKVHPTVMMATPEGGSETYKIFAGMLVNTQERYGEVFDYISKTHFDGVDDFNNYILEIMDRSWFFTDVDLTYGDKLITLSTCYWPLGREKDTRWVVFARKVRPGESEFVDTSVARRNYQAKLFQYYYDILGGSWGGSVWDRSKLLSY